MPNVTSSFMVRSGGDWHQIMATGMVLWGGGLHGRCHHSGCHHDEVGSAMVSATVVGRLLAWWVSQW